MPFQREKQSSTSSCALSTALLPPVRHCISRSLFESSFWTYSPSWDDDIAHWTSPPSPCSFTALSASKRLFSSIYSSPFTGTKMVTRDGVHILLMLHTSGVMISQMPSRESVFASSGIAREGVSVHIQSCMPTRPRPQILSNVVLHPKHPGRQCENITAHYRLCVTTQHLEWRVQCLMSSSNTEVTQKPLRALHHKAPLDMLCSRFM